MKDSMKDALKIAGGILFVFVVGLIIYMPIARDYASAVIPSLFGCVVFSACVFDKRLRETNTDLQTQIDDLKRELEEMKQKIQ